MLALVEPCKQTKNKKVMPLLSSGLLAFVGRQRGRCCTGDFLHCRAPFDLGSQGLTLFLAPTETPSEQGHAKWLNSVADLHKLVPSELFELEIFRPGAPGQLKSNFSISISTCV